MAQADARTCAFVPFGLSRVEAAHYVGVSPGTFDRMVADGMMPHPKRAYTRKVWVRPDLELALAALASDDAESTNDFDAD